MLTHPRIRWHIVVSLVLIILGTFFLLWISTRNFILFHSLIELFSIVVYASIFTIVYNTRHMVRDGFIKLIAVPLVYVALLEALHTLSYRGLAVFQWADANLPTQLWIASRGMQAASMVVATLFIGRNVRLRLPLAIYGLITAAVLASLFVWPIFPDCYIEGQGLTPFKKIAEYVISFLFLWTVLALWRHRAAYDRKLYLWLQASLTLMIVAELLFTLYAGVYDAVNVTGHLMLFASTVLIYQAVVDTGLRRPFDLLFRDLTLSEQRFRTVADFTHDWETWQTPDGRLEYVSPSCQRVTGYSVQRFLDDPELLFQIAHPQDRAALREHHRLKAAPHEPGEIDFRLITLEGQERWVSHVCMPVYEDGQYLGIRASNRDITERKRIEADRERLIAQLERSLKEIKQLSGLIPICASCKKVRTDEGYWQSVEEYVQAHSEADFTHGICPACMASLYPELFDELVGSQNSDKPA